MEIIKRFSNDYLAVKCAFCNGSGKYPEIFPIGIDYTRACDVCNGKGFNLFLGEEEFIVPCKCCDEKGKVSNDYKFMIGHCPVCSGKGFQNSSDSLFKSLDEQLWILINPKICEVSKKRFNDGHYADSVEAALKEINSTIKEIVFNKTKKEYDGSQLMERAFSITNPILILSDLTNESGKNIQKGFMQIFSGSMIGIRNPKAHSNINIGKELAIHYLFLASLLMNMIESSINQGN